MTMGKILKKTFAFFMAICVTFSGINPILMQSAYAADDGTVNHAVDISFSPQNLGSTDENRIDIETGRSGSFVLSMSVSHANDQTQAVTFKVKIRDKDVRLTDFDENGMYVVYGREYKLETDEEGNRYITGSAKPGDTFTQPFTFFYPNGVTPPTEVTVTEDDIEVTKPDDMPGNIIKEGGTINFVADFEWEPVQKTVNVDEIPIATNGKLSKDIEYTISAKSKQNQRDKAGIFTKEYTMTDTMTLPEGLTFVSGETVLSSDKKSVTIGGVTAASFSHAIESVERTSDNTLTFTYKVVNDTLAERPLDSKDPKETPDLSFKFTAKAAAINIDLDKFDTKNKIINKVDFNAKPCLPAEEHNSSDGVPVMIPELGKAFTISKTGSSVQSTLIPGGEILYTITVQNNNPQDLTVDIKDSIPSKTTYVEGSASDGGKKTGNQIVWEKVTIPAGQKAQRTFKVKVDEGLTSDGVINNKATATSEDVTKTSNETENKYTVPRAQLAVSKTSNKVNQSVTEGSVIRYTIKVTNNGMLEGSDTIVDTLPVHLELVESSLPDGASYDKETRTITIPVTVPAKQSKSYSFDAKLVAKGQVNNGTNIANTATLKNTKKSSTTSIKYKANPYSLSLIKEITGQKERTDLGEGWYEVSYRVTVTNSGGALWASDGEKIVDTMSGGLIPLDAYGWASNKTEGTITGKWTSQATGADGDTISAPAIKEGTGTSAQYTSTWSIGDMKAGEKATLDYKAVVELHDGILDTANVTNVAQIYKLGEGSGVSAKPNIISDKYISSVNGKAPLDKLYSDIHPGDVIKYKLTVKNTGYAAKANMLITDALPDFNRDSGFAWEIGKNVTVSGTFGGNTNHSVDALVWENVSIPAQTTKTVEVTLTFPEGVTFDRAFSERRATVYNTLTVKSADGKINQQHQVKHSTVPVELFVEKEALTADTIVSGKDFSFKLKPSDVGYPVSGLTLSDNFEALSGSADVKSIYTGSFTITGKDSYTLRLRYSGDKTSDISVKASGETLTLTAEQKKDLIGIDWVFGDVKSLKVSKDPQMTFTVKEDISKAVVGRNYVSYIYNDRVATDNDKVNLMPKDMLVKTAYKGEKPVTNPGGDNQLAVGDKVKFTIQYKNRHGKELNMTDVVLRDILATGGLAEESDVAVTIEQHLDADEQEVQNSDIELATTKFDITKSDIESPMAKRIDIKFKGGTLKENESIIISYTVTVGSGFSDSMADHNMGIDKNYDGKININMIHNEVSVSVDEETYETETDFYYTIGQPQLYFMKGLRSEREFNISGEKNHGASNFYSTGADFRLKHAKSLYGSSFSSFGYNMGSRTIGYDDFNMIDYWYPAEEYSIIIYNDAASPEPFTVEELTDQLPEGTKFLGGAYAVEAYTFYGGYSYYENPGMIYSTYRDKNEKSVEVVGDKTIDMYKNNSWYTGDYQKYSKTDDGDITYAEVVSTDPYGNSNKVKDHYVKITPQWDEASNKVTFKITEQNGDPVVLQPGERIAFYYGVIMDEELLNMHKYYDARQNSIESYLFAGTPLDDDDFVNTATLNIDKDYFKVRNDTGIETFNLNSAYRGSVDSTGHGMNDGDCVQISGDTFQSSVAIENEQVTGGIQKKAAARYSPGNLSDDEFITQYKNNQLSDVKSTDMNQLQFGDIVEWEITINIPTYMKGLYLFDAVKVEDTIPSPYEIITASSGTNMFITYGSDKRERAAEVTGNVSDILGAPGQTITINPSKRDSARTNELYASKDNTPDTLTLTYFTRYDSEAPLAYMNFENEAKVSLNGRTFDDGISGWGEPVRDGSGDIQYIKAVASVFPGANEMSQSYKKIEYKDQSANSVTGDHKVEVPKKREEVTYTSTLYNSGTSDYENLVIIDKLPEKGDTGTVNSAAERGSEFGVKLVEDGTVKVLINGEELSPDKYEITYTSKDKSDGYTADEWAGEAHADWKADPADAKAVRIKLKEPLPGDSKLEIVFDAYVTDEAEPGEIAWASFGYRYQNTEKSQKPIYAEPAKVGVELPAGTVSVTKQNTSGDVLAGAEFTIYTDKECKTPYEIDGSPAKLITGSDGKASFDKLALETDYWIKETKAPKGYIADGTVYKVRATESVPAVTIGTNGVVTNETEKKPGELTITKQVTDDADNGILGGLFDKSFNVTVSGKFSDGTTEKTYSLKNNEYVTVPNVIYGETYTIKEEISQEYTAEYYVTVNGSTANDNSVTMGEGDASVLIENTSVKEDALYITKSLNGASGTETYRVFVEGTFDDGNGPQKTTKTYTFGPNEYGKLKEVEGAIHGENYIISEESGNYIATVKVDGSVLDPDQNNTVQFADSGKTVIEVVNTETTSISGEKTWNDNNNAGLTRPDSVTVELYQKIKGESGEGIKYKELEVQEGDGGVWNYTFSDLPKYSPDGKEYIYEIKEQPVDNYEAQITGTDLKNNLLMDLSGEKIWNDGNNADKTRPSEITVSLYQNNGEDPYATLTVRADSSGKWEYTFTDLPKYDENGDAYKYTVKEENVSNGYVVEYPGADLDPSSGMYDIDIINTRVVSVEGEKIWKEDENNLSERPEYITVNLLQNGEVIDQKIADESTEWKYSFTDLPKYDAKGAEVMWKA